MIKGTKEYLDDVAKNYVCSEHQTPVVVAWHAKENSYVLRCGQGEYPEEVTRQLSLTEAYKAGEELPSFVEDNIKRRQKRKAMSQQRQQGKPELSLIPHNDLGSGELLVPELIEALVKYASKYQLDPSRGHVVVMYGKPYITIDGYLFHARQSRLPYQLKSRPASDVERRSLQVGEDDHAWISEVIFADQKGSFVGLGIVTKEEMTAKSPRDANKLRSPVVAAHPWQLAQKRAEWQALRRAFPIGETEEVKED